MKAAQSSKKALRRLLGRERYSLARLYFGFYFSGLQGKDVVFLHTMGKVGSSSVSQSLKAAGVPRHNVVYRTYFLSQEGTELLRKLEEEGYGGWGRVPLRWQLHFAKCRFLYSRIKFGRPWHRNYRVVTLTRDPIATNIAGFFQNYIWWPPDLVSKCKDRRPGYLDELTQRFFDLYPHDVPITWFNMELKPVFGVDVYASEFPKARGYEIYHGTTADVLVLKLEDLDHNAQEAFDEFLGLQSFTLVRANVGAEKWYSTVYREFKDSIVLPESYLDRMYNSQYVQHFYGQEQINALRSRWSRT